MRNSCRYTGRDEKCFHKGVKSVPTHIKSNFRNRMVSIHFETIFTSRLFQLDIFKVQGDHFKGLLIVVSTGIS